MTTENGYFASGNWHVTAGKADEFVERWTEMLTWTNEAHSAVGTARLLRDMQDPNHFLSFADWKDPQSFNAWRNDPEFAKRFDRCQTLCDSMQSSGYQVVRTV